MAGRKATAEEVSQLRRDGTVTKVSRPGGGPEPKGSRRARERNRLNSLGRGWAGRSPGPPGSGLAALKLGAGGGGQAREHWTRP